MRKYHPNWAIVWLVVIGVGIFLLSILAGIWSAHGLGVLFNCWGACPNYFADFLGGALGLTLGFVLDKFCIERISHVLKYKKLMKIVLHELDKIKKVCYKKIVCYNDDYMYECVLSTENIWVNDSEKLHVTSKKVDVSSGNISVPEDDLKINENISIKDLGKDSILEEVLKKLEKYDTPYTINEYILDDLVTNAETMSILANLPLASKYSIELIEKLCLIQKYIEEYEKHVNECERLGKEYKEKLEAKNLQKEEKQQKEKEIKQEATQTKKRWLLLQYYINCVIELL